MITISAINMLVSILSDDCDMTANELNCNLIITHVIIVKSNQRYDRIQADI